MSTKSLHNQSKPNHLATARSNQPLWSLAIAILFPLSLVLAIITLFGSGYKYRSLPKPFWFPPLWLVHLASIGSSVLMSIAAWLVWAKSGFYAPSSSDSLPLYISQVSLSLVWNPLVLVMGANRVGLFYCVVHLGTLVVCYVKFGKIVPFSKSFVRPCLAWTLFLFIVTWNLIFI